MSRVFYSLFLFFYRAGIGLAAFVNPKARLWIRGRRGQTERVREFRNAISDKQLVWIHCASLGEFEQGRPLLDAVRDRYPEAKIAVTFFSPSGYEVRKNFGGADAVFYLPADGSPIARAFIDALRPSLVLWIKYDYWFYFLRELKSRGIPVLLISAIYRETQPFFRWYGKIWRDMLTYFDRLFVQDDGSLKLLRQVYNGSNAIVAGDTRFDRVLKIADSAETPASLQTFCSGHPTLVAGSTWEDDEVEIVHYARIHPNMKFIIAPHEISVPHPLDIKKLFGRAAFYSEGFTGDIQTIVIDNIGMLASLYTLATVCYVGGGFNESGIHNILEAAVYGKPVVFGPEYRRSAEAEALLQAGGAFSFKNALELEALLDGLFNNEAHCRNVGRIAAEFVRARAGATDEVMKYIQEKRLLTN